MKVMLLSIIILINIILFLNILFRTLLKVSCASRVVTKSKAVPLHAMKELGCRGGIARTHSRPRH
jgi:hypothetical protein